MRNTTLGESVKILIISYLKNCDVMESLVLLHMLAQILYTSMKTQKLFEADLIFATLIYIRILPPVGVFCLKLTLSAISPLIF